MPYDFTAAGAGDITFGATSTGLADNRTVLVCGWYRPSILTTGLYLWSFGNIAGLSLGAADTLVLTVDNATTDGVFSAAAAGLVVDEWRFIAVMASTENTGVLAAVRVWTGGIGEAPVERTVTTTTAPVGNFTGSATFYIGNLGTSAVLSFGGQIADVSLIITEFAYGATTHPFGLATSGAITATEAQRVYETWVWPLWLGDTSMMWRDWEALSTVLYHLSLDAGDRVVGVIRGGLAIMPAPTITYNTATWSQVGAPRPRMGPAMFPDRRR